MTPPATPSAAPAKPSGHSGKRARAKAKSAGVKKDARRYVLRLPLNVNQRERMLIDQRLHQVGMLRNSILTTLLKRLDAMRCDPRWEQAGRMRKGNAKTAAYKALKVEYRLDGTDDAVRVAQAHWQANFTDLLDMRCAGQLAREVWASISEYMHGKRDRPRHKPSRERNVVYGGTPVDGLMLAPDGNLTWGCQGILDAEREAKRTGSNRNLARKRLRISLDWSYIPAKRREYVKAQTVKQVGIQREMIRGEIRYFAMLVMEGAPYRSDHYLMAAAQKAASPVGLDIGPTLLAIASDSGIETVPLCDPELIHQRAEQAAHLRRKQKALDRSRRSANPECFDHKGRAKKGMRQTNTSKRGRRKKIELAEAERKATARRDADRVTLTRHVVLNHGARGGIEETHYTAWQKSNFKFGRRMGLTSPGALHESLRREMTLVGGELHDLDAYTYAFSQHCLCGRRAKKDLKTRVHSCPDCGLTCDRDHLAATLMHLVVQNGAANTLDDLPPRASDGADGTPESTRRAHALAERLASAHQTRAIEGSIPRHPKRLREEISGRDTPASDADAPASGVDVGEAAGCRGSRVVRDPDPSPRRKAPSGASRAAGKADTLGLDVTTRRRSKGRSTLRHST